MPSTKIKILLKIKQKTEKTVDNFAIFWYIYYVFLCTKKVRRIYGCLSFCVT